MALERSWICQPHPLFSYELRTSIWEPFPCEVVLMILSKVSFRSIHFPGIKVCRSPMRGNGVPGSQQQNPHRSGSAVCLAQFWPISVVLVWCSWNLSPSQGFLCGWQVHDLEASRHQVLRKRLCWEASKKPGFWNRASLLWNPGKATQTSKVSVPPSEKHVPGGLNEDINVPPPAWHPTQGRQSLPTLRGFLFDPYLQSPKLEFWHFREVHSGVCLPIRLIISVAKRPQSSGLHRADGAHKHEI